MNLQRIFYPFTRKMPDPNAPRYGDLYERALASAVDVTLVFTLFSWVFQPINDHFMQRVDVAKLAQIDPAQGARAVVQQLFDSQMPLWFSANILVQGALVGVVYVLIQILYDTTPGRWLFGLKIVRHETHEAPEKWRYVLRYAAYGISCFPLMMGVLWGVFNKKHRTWHDYIAGTVVLNIRPHGWYWSQVKRIARWLWGKVTGSRAVEETMPQPTAEQRQNNGDKPV